MYPLHHRSSLCLVLEESFLRFLLQNMPSDKIFEVIVQFVDIGGIVDHHCLNFSFI